MHRPGRQVSRASSAGARTTTRQNRLDLLGDGPLPLALPSDDVGIKFAEVVQRKSKLKVNEAAENHELWAGTLCHRTRRQTTISVKRRLAGERLSPRTSWG